jgi:hypothetical protein
MTLEQQLATLSDCGINLDNGITIEDMLYSFSSEEYEKRPFDLVLFVLGIEVEREPWNRPFCSRVWNFDLECITSTGDYTRIVKRLCQVAGMPDGLNDVRDFVDLQRAKAWLKYRVGDVERNLSAKVTGTWADPQAVSHVMRDIQQLDGRRFYSKDNGQAMVLYYLDPDAAATLNRLAHGTLQPALDDV